MTAARAGEALNVGSVARRQMVEVSAFFASNRVSVSDGWMINFNARMLRLRVHREAISHIGHVHNATSRRRFWTLIHHAAAPRTVRPIAVTMIETALHRALMPPTSRAQLPTSCRHAARLHAVSVAAITSRAQEENLVALGAHDETKRFHVPARGTDRNLIARGRS